MEKNLKQNMLVCMHHFHTVCIINPGEVTDRQIIPSEALSSKKTLSHQVQVHMIL